MNDQKIALLTCLHDPCMSRAACGDKTGLGLSSCLSVDGGGQLYIVMPSPIYLAVEVGRLLGS